MKTNVRIGEVVKDWVEPEIHPNAQIVLVSEAGWSVTGPFHKATHLKSKVPLPDLDKIEVPVLDLTTIKDEEDERLIDATAEIIGKHLSVAGVSDVPAFVFAMVQIGATLVHDPVGVLPVVEKAEGKVEGKVNGRDAK